MVDAYERKLRPVYDAIDGRNYKAAVKLATAALQKYKEDQLLRALKSWALLKSGRQEEAVSQCEKLGAEIITDEAVLNVCGAVLRAVGKGTLMTAIHAAASEARPKDVALLRSLFGAYVRELDFAKQQQVALKLQRVDSHSEGEYIWWAVVSFVLQAKAAKAGQASAMSAEQLVQLAQSMAEKRLEKRGSDEGYEAVMLYITTLVEQGKFREAAEQVATGLGDAIQMLEERFHVRANLLVQAGELREGAELAKRRWMEHPEDWRAWQIFLDCALPLPGTSSETQQAPDAVETGIAAAEDLLREAGDAGSAEASKSAARGLALARVQLEVRRQSLPSCAKGNSSRLGAEGQGLAEALLGCFLELGHTMSCPRDLRQYTNRLNLDKRLWLADKMMASVKVLRHTDGDNLDLESIRRLVSAHQIEADMGLPAFRDAESAVAHALQLGRLFFAAQHLYADLDEKERGPADELPAIAVADLVAAWKLDGSSTHLLQLYLVSIRENLAKFYQQDLSPSPSSLAVLLLEAVQQRRKVSAGLRIASAGLYSALGAPFLASQHLAALEIKHIQHDTLSGHLHLPVLLAGLCTEEAERLLVKVDNLYDNHLRDFGDTLLLSYTSRNYTKADEFVAFKERLEASFTRTLCSVEGCVLCIYKAALSGREALQASTARLAKVIQGNRDLLWPPQGTPRTSYNHDLSVRPPWLPPSSAPSMLALADWWQQPASQTAGEGGCWWLLQNESAEQGAFLAQSHAHAAHCSTGLRRTALLADLLASLVWPSGPSLPLFQDAFRKRLAVEGLSIESLEAWMSQLSSRVRQLPLSTACQQQDTALFALLHTAEGCDGRRTRSWTKVFCESLSATCERLEHEFQSNESGLPLFGGGWIWAASFIRCLVWVTAVAGAAKAAAGAIGKKGKKGKAQQASPGSEGRTGKDSPWLENLAADELSAAAGEAAERLQGTLKRKALVKTEMNEQLQQLSQGLWCVEGKLDAHSAVQRLVRDQEGVLRRLDKALSGVAHLCSSRG